MREGKATRRAQALKAEVVSVKDVCRELVAEHRTGGNQHRRQVSMWQVQKIAFHGISRKSRDLAKQYGCTTKWIRSLITFVAAAYLQVQLIVLGCLVARAALQQPDLFGFRLAWDETGQRSLAQRSSPTFAPTDSSQQHKTTTHNTQQHTQHNNTQTHNKTQQQQQPTHQHMSHTPTHTHTHTQRDTNPHTHQHKTTHSNT